MSRAEVLETLKKYISNEVMEGRDIGLDYSTPLLEWGVINSLEIIRLLTFIDSSFKVSVPMMMVNAEHFKDMHAIASLIESLSKS